MHTRTGANIERETEIDTVRERERERVREREREREGHNGRGRNTHTHTHTHARARARTCAQGLTEKGERRIERQTSTEDSVHSQQFTGIASTRKLPRHYHPLHTVYKHYNLGFSLLRSNTEGR